eukprot:scaffold189091_cov56-Cyclotella_meneghiniana.AAC.2
MVILASANWESDSRKPKWHHCNTGLSPSDNVADLMGASRLKKLIAIAVQFDGCIRGSSAVDSPSLYHRRQTKHSGSI